MPYFYIRARGLKVFCLLITYLFYGTYPGETPLHVACNRSKIERIRMLISAGALVNTKDNAGWTPLHEACCYGNVEVVRELASTPGIASVGKTIAPTLENCVG